MCTIIFEYFHRRLINTIGEIKLWDVGGDRFDPLNGVGEFKIVNLSLNEWNTDWCSKRDEYQNLKLMFSFSQFKMINVEFGNLSYYLGLITYNF